MESHAPPGAIQVTERTYRLLADDFELERRTGVPVKGEGDMTTTSCSASASKQNRRLPWDLKSR